MRPAFGRGKDAHFTDQGYPIHGTVHVGVNDGQELGWYLHVGQTPILGFEPIPDVFRQTAIDFAPEIDAGIVRLANCALGDRTGEMVLSIPERIVDGVEATQGASARRELYLSPEYRTGRKLTVQVWRFDEWAARPAPYGIDMAPYDLLAIDVQGMELEVLRGFGAYLDGFRYLMVECSSSPIYEGEASAWEVSDFLASKGFRRDSPIVSHNDVFFLKDRP